MDEAVAEHVVEGTWADHIEPALLDYIAIPALSPAFDADWAEHGHLDDAVALVRDWLAARPVEGMAVERLDLSGRTPLLVCDVAATPGHEHRGTVLLYGHLDKQPPMEGWVEGLGPFTPVRRGDRLYGRGGADDGYAAFAALAAIEAVQRAGGAHARCVLVVEASEESGSPDLPAHVDALIATGRLGDVDLVVCLDSGCATYDRLWLTTSLRGLVGASVKVEVLTEGVHSGIAGGIAPSSFRVLRALLDRIEDATTGRPLLDAFHVEIPPDRRAELADTAAELGADAHHLPWVEGVRPQPGHDALAELRAGTWEPAIAYVGADGFPPTATAGNVLRPATTLALAIRLPPTCDPDAAYDALHRALTTDVPSGARVTVEPRGIGSGWNAPPFAPWLLDALDAASQRQWGKPMRTMGEGGSIPFMAMLGERFPAAQFAVVGVLGPGSNAHGPNEFLDLAYARRLTACLASLLGAHART